MFARALAICQVQQMRVLDQGSPILGSCGFTCRNHGGPQLSERGLGLEAANDGVQGAEFSWVGWLLLKVHSELLQHRETSY
jgi:hypothetical protein